LWNWRSPYPWAFTGVAATELDVRAILYRIEYRSAISWASVAEALKNTGESATPTIAEPKDRHP
jgi:hypothetical protein